MHKMWLSEVYQCLSPALTLPYTGVGTHPPLGFGSQPECQSSLPGTAWPHW